MNSLFMHCNITNDLVKTLNKTLCKQYTKYIKIILYTK